MDIGQAVEAMRGGSSVGRPGWNGKGMFLNLQHGEVMERGINQLGVRCDDFVLMRTVQGTMIPWNCSQADLLAKDWEIIRPAGT